MTSEAIIAYWGIDHLRRWTRASLSDAVVSNKTKNFLLEVGFPVNVDDWSFRFDVTEEETRQVAPRLLIGFDYEIPICVDGWDRVITVEPTAERFVNLTIDYFAQFLVLYHEYRRSSNDEKVSFQQIEKGMREIDFEAFNNCENYWPVIFEQIEDGLL